MLDAIVKPRLDPFLDHAGRWLARRGIGADAVTLVGLAIGLAATGAIAAGALGAGLALILASRLLDGLDGAVARASRRTDFGGYLDIACDFAFYAAVPLAFAVLDAAANALAAAFLLAAFYINGASFLGFAVLAERRGMTSDARGAKNLYFSGGLLEGTETIAFFVALCLFPAAFPALAAVFAVLCLWTAVTRMLAARRLFAGVSDRAGAAQAPRLRRPGGAKEL